MEALVKEVPAALPPLSPAQMCLIEAMSKKGADQRSVALAMSLDIGTLRTQVAKLARALSLPVQDSPAREFTELARKAARLSALQTEAVEQLQSKFKLHGVADKVIAEWQEALAKVAAAIAKGVLVSVDPYKIRPMRGQPREYFPEEEQGSLEGSLELMGQIQDIIIRKKPLPRNLSASAVRVFESEERIWRIADTEYEICDGERRWRGAMAKGLLKIRAKLIDVDDQGAYLVAGVSNFNRVGHTTLEKARNIKRLMEGDSHFPIEVVAAMQGVSVQTANKLLAALKLPPDIQALMDPTAQREKGEEVLGKSPTYAIARLAHNSRLHDDARHLAGRYVRGEIKMTELNGEVDRILSRSGASRNVLAERQQPARRLKFVERRISLAVEYLRDAKGRLEDLKQEGGLPQSARGLRRNLREIGEVSQAILEIV